MHPLHRRVGALCGGVPHHFHRWIITTAPSCVLQVHTRVRQVWSKKRSAKAGGGILRMALHAVTIWQVDPKGQWVSTFGVADIAVQRTGRSSRFVWSEGPP